MIRNNRGSVFYVVVSLITITFILGISFLFHLSNEFHAITFSQAAEVCLNLAESCEKEAYFLTRFHMNLHGLPPDKQTGIYKHIRSPIIGEKRESPPFALEAPETQQQAAYFGAEIVSIMGFYWKRDFFARNIINAPIDLMTLDPKETFGTFSIEVIIRYKQFLYNLRVDREMKVAKTTPPRADFTLWVKDASVDTLNPWKSFGGWTPAHLMVLNGTRLPVDRDFNGSIFLGGGRALTSGEIAFPDRIQYYSEPNDHLQTGNRFQQNPIIINITMGGDSSRWGLLNNDGVKTTFYKKHGIRSTKEFYTAGIPHNDFSPHHILKPQTIFTVEVMGLKKTVYSHFIGHDQAVVAQNPFVIPKIGVQFKDYLPGLSYFVSLYNESLAKTGKFFNQQWIDITMSGIDLIACDFWRDWQKSSGGQPQEPTPQYPRAIYGQVYKSSIKLNAMLLDFNRTVGLPPGAPSPSNIWGILPWVPKNYQLASEPMSAFFEDSNKHSAFANEPYPGTFTKTPLIANTFGAWGLDLTKTYNATVDLQPKQMTYHTFKSNLEIRAYNTPKAGQNQIETIYVNPITTIQEDVGNWSADDYFPPEFSYDKIAYSYPSFDDFKNSVGYLNEKGHFFTLAEQLDGLAGKDANNLDLAKHPIIDFTGNRQKLYRVLVVDGDIYLPSNIRYYGRGWLCFMFCDGVSSLKVDGIAKFRIKGFCETQAERTDPTLINNPLNPDNMSCTLAVLGVGKYPSIHLTNKLVEASLFAPKSTIELDMDGTKSGWVDSIGCPMYDIDVLGNVVVGELHLDWYPRNHLDPHSKATGKNVRQGLRGKTVYLTKTARYCTGGGVIRWDPSFKIEVDKVGGRHDKYYGVSLGKKISFWKLTTQIN